jgi:hypothetical protein
MLSDGASASRVKAAILSALASGRLDRARLDDAVLRNIELKLRFRMDLAFDAGARARALASLPGLVAEHGQRLSATGK